MWIVLLDHSGSMGEPFEAANVGALGRVRTVNVQVKLDAAKESFLLELRRLPTSMRVLLFGFTEQVTEVYSGRASEIAEFERRVNELEPFDGTDIAAALERTIDYANHKPEVLLVTDGKSDLTAAKSAAHRCARANIRVDVLMIDPTDEGLAMAGAIAGITHGRWDPVANLDQLASRTREIGDQMARDSARAEQLLKQADDEFHALQTSVEEEPRVSFSAGYPVRIDQRHKYPLVVYVHLDRLGHKIKKYIADEIGLSGATPVCTNAAAGTRIPRGTLITVQPNIPGIFANPPRQEVVWLEDYHKLNFEIRHAGPSAAGTSCVGFIDILGDGAFLGHIPVSIAVVGSSQSPARAIPSTVTTHPAGRIFASYAHEDEAVVQACKETYKAFGIHLYVDRDDLLSGQPWRQTLEKLIAKCDLFQLYWSQPAANSTEVAREWQLALVVNETRSSDFIRPLFWQKPMLEPPTQLAHLHFAYLDLGKLRVPHARVESQEASADFQEFPISSSVFPVISLTGDDAPGSIAIIQESIGRIAGFLEHITELRYYPPPTLLVDEYVVKAVRSYLTIDLAAEKDSQDDEIEFSLEILQSMALAFHVHALEPEGIRGKDEECRFYRLNSEQAWNDLEHVRDLCEYIFSHPVKQFLQGKDPFEQPGRHSSEEFKKSAKKDFLLRHTLASEIGHTYAVATPQDKERIARTFGSGTLELLLNWKTEVPQQQLLDIADRALSDDYLNVAERYRNGFFDLFRDSETTFCRSTEFHEYLRAWFDQWRHYLAAVQSHGVAKVEIEYPVSRPALDWLKARFPNIHFNILSEGENWRDRKGPPVCTWALPVIDFGKAVSALEPIVMEAVGAPMSNQTRVQKFFITTAPTYGIFASAESEQTIRYLYELARKRSWPNGLALAGCHKVLLCANVIERYKSALIELEVDEAQADQMAAWFLIATLVHEHFHAILATGIGKQGIASWAASNWGEWQKGDALNESLAAWVERYFFRDNELMQANINEYINGGAYPDWPYRGAEKIENIFRQSGLPGVRVMIQRFREDPKFAQEMFDELPWPEEANPI